jgi:hypothetical protein
MTNEEINRLLLAINPDPIKPNVAIIDDDGEHD